MQRYSQRGRHSPNALLVSPCSSHRLLTPGDAPHVTNASDDTLAPYVKQQASVFSSTISSCETAVMLGIKGHRPSTAEFDSALGKKLEA